MIMATFKQTFAVDTNGIPVADAVGTIHDLSDTEALTPLAVTDLSGIPMATVSISASGVNQAFVVDDRTQVLWISSDKTLHVIIESLDAMEERAASAVETASSALGQVSEMANRVGVPGGIAGLNSEGNVIDANSDVVGNDTRRAGAVIFAQGADTARPTTSRDVMVLWTTEGGAPVNALAGVDVWINGGMIQL